MTRQKTNFKNVRIRNTVLLFTKLCALLAPPPKVTLAQWAENNRVLSQEEASAAGPWRNERVPYGVGIMDAISDPSTRKVVVMAGAQSAKTNLGILNVIGYYIDYDPTIIMVVQPTVEMGETFSKYRVTPMLRDTPCLRGKVSDEKSRTSANTIMEKAFPGGYLVIAGANSAASLKSRPVRVLLFDEVDEAPFDLKGQGDPIELAIVRTTTFPNHKIVLVSTPTIKGKSRIETAYKDSTQERWQHMCPSCGEWSHFMWDRLDFGSMMMCCPYCGCLHTRHEWERVAGRWEADNPGHPTRGFHLSGLDSPWLSWEKLVSEWIEANRRFDAGDYTAMATFKNTRLGESWEIQGEGASGDALDKRREIYRAPVPDGVCILTMGVDVQGNRLAYEVVGWGLGKESWGIEYGELWGDPGGWDVWNRLDDVLGKAWRYANGKPLRIRCTAVDSGYSATQVYTYCKAREKRGVWAIKGRAGDGVPLIKTSTKSKREGVYLFIVGVDGGKSDIMSRLRVGQPGDGYCHFPKGEDDEPVRGYDSAYFEGLTCEKHVPVTNKHGFTKYEWVKPPGARNEPLDCRNYAAAALRILSARTDEMLSRLHALALWASAPIQNDRPEPVSMPPARKKKKTNRNAVAASNAIQL